VSVVECFAADYQLQFERRQTTAFEFADDGLELA